MLHGFSGFGIFRCRETCDFIKEIRLDSLYVSK